MTSPPSSATPTSQSIAAPLVVWLTLQLLALLIAGARVPLSAHYPQAPETLALQMMVTVQTIALAMLAPLLLRSTRSAVAVTLTAGPMLLLAGALAMVESARVTIVWGNLVMFLFALFFWRMALSHKRIMWLVAIANVLTVGGAVVGYLSAEFLPASRFNHAIWSPTVAVVQISRGDAHHIQQWVGVAVMCMTGALAAAVTRRRNHGSPVKC